MTTSRTFGPPAVGRKVRARAPLRLGLAGGGTDLPHYADAFGGAVLNATIDRFAHATLTLLEVPRFRAEAGDLDRYDEAECAGLSIDEGLPLHRAVYVRMADDFLDGARPGVMIQTMVDAPPGSGLGSSSAAVVAMVEAFRHAFRLDHLTPHEVAQLAYRIERVDLGLQGGRQDQYAAAFGGINFIEFGRGSDVTVEAMMLDAGARHEIEASIVICHTGQSRESHRIIADQTSRIRSAETDTMAAMHELKQQAYAMRDAVAAGDLRAMASVLDQSWQAKKRTSDRIATDLIDTLWTVAHRNGAVGGKISGAGGGGFLMLLTDAANRARLMRALAEAGGTPDTVQFSACGTHSWIVR